MMVMLSYHVLLAAKSLRRDLATSLIMLFALAVGAGTWSQAVVQYIRFNGYELRLPPSLHQVEILRPRHATSVFMDTADASPYMQPTAMLMRTSLSYPEYRALVGSAVPPRQTAGIRSEVLVTGPTGAVDVRMARFTNADFFTMFERPFAVGGPWSPAEDQRAADAAADLAVGPVVLGLATGRALFPRGGALGRTIRVEGRPYRVVGVLSRHQPLNAPWQLLMTGGVEDAVFLPLGDFNRLAVRPDAPIYRTPVTSDRAALLASDALFVTFWVDLPTPALRAAYTHQLDTQLGPGRYVLRSLPEWRHDLGMPTSQISFFSFMGAAVLLGGGFNLSRWLLIKGLSRSPELGVFRALGAPRASLFWRVVAEAALFAAPVALLAPVMAWPMVWLFNRYVHVVDMPLELGVISVVASIVPPFVVCLVGSLYPAWRLARIPPTVHLGRP